MHLPAINTSKEAPWDNREGQVLSSWPEDLVDLAILEVVHTLGIHLRRKMLLKVSGLRLGFDCMGAGGLSGSQLLLRAGHRFAGIHSIKVRGSANSAGFPVPFALVFIQQQRGRASPKS